MRLKTQIKKFPLACDWTDRRRRKTEEKVGMFSGYTSAARVSSQTSEPRYRFPRFGANGLHPGRRNDPSPIRPEEVATAMAFLQMLKPTQRAYVSSYTLKHAAENWGRKVGLCAYVSNGALILAALMLGLIVRPYDGWLNPNAAIGVSRADFGRITGAC
jgi:hypothetical protein